MAREEQIIIEVEVNAGESAQKLAEVKKKLAEVKKNIADLKKEQKQLQDFIRAGADVTGELSARYAENAASLKQLTAEEKMYTAQLNIATQGEKKYGDSLVEQAALLAQLKQEYRGLSAAQRESAAGKELQKSIQDLDSSLKNANFALGDFQSNVGNYASALYGLNGNVVKVASLFQGGFTNGLKAAGTALKSFGKAIIATPIGWILAAVAAVVAIFNKLKDAFKQNDDAMTALQRAMASLKPIMDAVNKAFSFMAEVVAKVVTGVMAAVTAVLKMIPAYRQASDAAQELVTAQDQLQDKERDYVVASAERQKQIAELKKKERSDEKLTLDEREAMLKEVDALEKQDAEERRNLAAERYRIRKEELDRKRKLNDEEKDELARLRADMINTETEYLNATTRIAQREKGVREQKAKDEEAAAERARQAWRKAQQERQQALKTEEEELRKLEDMRIRMIEDEYQRERKTTEVNYNRQIDDIRKRLDTEKNLTAKTREALNTQIIFLEGEKVKELQRIDNEHNEWIKQQDKELADYEENLWNGVFGRLDEISKEEQDKARARYELMRTEYENSVQDKLNAVYGSVTETARIELEQAEQFYKSLADMDAVTRAAIFGEGDQAEQDYKNSILKAEAEILAARQKNAEAQQQQIADTVSAMKTMTAALDKVFEAAAGDSEQYEKFKKAITIADATLSMAQAIASAIAASTPGDPYTTAIRIAAAVAEVMSQFAVVISTLNSVDIPSAGSYSAGGIVPGTSYNDELTANVSSGEMILNRAQQQRLFDLISTGAPVRPVDYDRLAAAVAEGVSRMPAPVLDYREMVMFGEKVKMIERKATK